MRHVNSKIDWYIICRVREIREELNLDQDDLAFHLKVSEGFIGQIESPKYRAKYNIHHLNELAKLFNRSPKEFMPDQPL